MPATTIDGAIARLEEMLARWDADGDFRAVFVRSYLAMTRRMKEAVEAAAFEDNAWMEKLDVCFANEFFDAVDAHEAGSAAVPRCWRFALDRAAGKKTLVLQDLLLGMNAHIIRDLAVALYKTGIGGAERSRRRADHERVNDVLGGMIDPIQDEVSANYSWLLRLLDRGLRSDEVPAATPLQASGKPARAILDIPDREDYRTNRPDRRL